MYSYSAKIVRWLDGDTCDVLVDLGFKVSVAERVRVFGINCPEIHSRNFDEKRAGLLAFNCARTLAPEGMTFQVQTHKNADPNEKFGRWLATITLADGKDFAAEMILAKHAVAYAGGKREPWKPDDSPPPGNGI